MSFDTLLVHQVRVWRRSGSTDRFGQPVEAVTSGAPLHTYPCRWSMSGGGRTVDGRMQDTFQNTYMVFTKPGVDIREDDLILVVDQDGNAQFPLSRIQDSDDIFAGIGTRKPHHVQMRAYVERGPASAV